MKQILLIVCLLIAYGSLYPFQFHYPSLSGGPLWIWLSDWPRHVDRFVLRDVLVNLAIYAPLGMFGFLSFDGERRAARAVAATLLLALGLSVSMEILQLFVPTRTSEMSDVLANVAGAGIGIAFGLLYRESLRRTVAHWEGEWLFEFSGPMLLLYCWAAYQVFPLFPALGRRALTAHIRFLLSGVSFGVVDFLGAWVAWMTAARLLEGLLGPRKVARAMLVLLGGLPLRLLIANRNLTASELLGAAAAWLVWSLWLCSHPRRAHILAALFLAFVALQGLAPFRLQLVPHPFCWMPFAGALSSAWDSVLTVLLLKCYWYGACIWLCRAAGSRLFPATAAVAALLAILEAVQQWLPGRTPEITNPMLAVLLALVFWLGERHHRAGPPPRSAAHRMLP